MKRLLGLSVLCACGASGALAAFAFAEDGPPGGTTAATTTTATTETATTTASTTAPAALAEGVTVGGFPVGGLTPGAAAGALRTYFETPLQVSLGRRVVVVDPNELAAPNLSKAIERAKAAQPGQRVNLVVVVRTGRIHAYVAKLAKGFDRPAAASRLILRHLKPFVTPAQPGRRLLRTYAERMITNALTKNRRETIDLPTATMKPPKAAPLSVGSVIVIRRGTNRLYLYERTHFVRRFPVATGQTVYPTPLGRFEIVVKWKNPWWYPPNDPWAKGEKPTPPGPGNPLGSRWMGLSAPGVGIHGTNNDSSIGYSVSHGCVRMHVADSEWLFDHVSIGTPVFIVAA